MDLSKLPPFMAASLGLLGCIVAEPCLSLSYESESTSATGSGTSSGTSSGTGSDTSSGSGSGSGSDATDSGDTSTGPCLSPPLDSSGTDTDTGTGSDSGTGSGSDSDTGSGSDSGTSSGGMFDPPPPTSRAAAVERVLSRGTLPADVLDRLRAIASNPKG